MSEQMPLILDQIGERRSNIDIWKKRKKKKKRQIHMEQVLYTTIGRGESILSFFLFFSMIFKRERLDEFSSLSY
jgi:hypothetical protein